MRTSVPVLTRFLPLVLLAAACGCFHQEYVPVGTVAQDLGDASGVARIEVRNTVGSIAVEPSPDASIAIRAIVLLREDLVPAEPAPLRFEEHVQVVRGGQELRIARVREEEGEDWQLQLQVCVPPGRSLAVDLETGGVHVVQDQVQDLRVGLGTGSAEVRLEGCAGRLAGRVDTGELDVHVRGRSPAAGCDLRVDTGQLTVRLPEHLAGTFEATVDTGGLSAHPRFGLIEQRDMASVTAKGSSGMHGPSHRFHVSTGEIRLH